METETYIIEVGEDCCCKDISDDCDTVYYDLYIAADFYSGPLSNLVWVATVVGYCYNTSKSEGSSLNVYGTVPNISKDDYSEVFVKTVYGKKCYSSSAEQYNFRSSLEYHFS